MHHDKPADQIESVNLCCCNSGHSSPSHGLIFMHLQEGMIGKLEGNTQPVRGLGDVV